MTRPIRAAFALIDWHNVQGYVSPPFQTNPKLKLADALLVIQQKIAASLSRGSLAAFRFRVALRVYHGWHSGKNKMPIHNDFSPFIRDESLARKISNCSFLGGLQLGNELVCDADSQYELFSTYRGGGQDKGQKMVDTAIVCDLLHLLHMKSADLGIIVSDDDDYIPAMLTAKSWAAPILLLRKPGRGVEHVTSFDCSNELAYWT